MKREWNDDMREISGFGGTYEAGCRAMLNAEIDDESGKRIKIGQEATGAMVQWTVNHVVHAHQMGWEAYVKKMSEPKESGR